MLMKLFRQVSLIEGVTTLLLFLVAMPLKYGFGYDALIRPFGMLHGAAFVAYLAVMVVAFSLARIGPTGWLRSVLAAFVPFGTFFNDHWLKAQSGEAAPAASGGQQRLAVIAMMALGAAVLAGGFGPQAGRSRTEAAAQVSADPAQVVMAGFVRIPDLALPLPWNEGEAVVLGPQSALADGAEVLFADGSRVLALQPVTAGQAAPVAAYDRRFVIAITGLALLQQQRSTGAGWGPERLLAEARLSGGGTPAREAALAQVSALPNRP